MELAMIAIPIHTRQLVESASSQSTFTQPFATHLPILFTFTTIVPSLLQQVLNDLLNPPLNFLTERVLPVRGP